MYILIKGAWAVQHYGQHPTLQRAGVPLHVERRVLFWFQPKQPQESMQHFKVHVPREFLL